MGGTKNGLELEPEAHSFLRSFDQIADPSPEKNGGKAANLVILRKIGLPVPDGYCVDVGVHDCFLEHGELPDGLVDEIIEAKKALGGKVIIRSSATCEDGSELSMAGVFHSYCVEDDDQITKVVEQIYCQSRSEDVANFMDLRHLPIASVKMGLIVQRMIESEIAGVIYTGVNDDKALVQYTDRKGADLVDGNVPGSSVLIGVEGRILESSGFEQWPLSPVAISQVAKLTRVIEQLFGGIPQDIEFAYRDGTVYIVQARTQTADLGWIELDETPEDCLEAAKHQLRQLVAEEKHELGTNTAIFSDANYSELLPRPTEMDIGVYMYVWGGSNGIPGATQLGRAEMGYQIGDEAIGIIKYIGGRTYSSIARYAAIYHAGFPETKAEYFSTLVNEYLEAIQVDPERGSYPQMGLFLQDPTFEDLQVRYGNRAEEYLQVYRDFVARMRNFADKFMTQFYGDELGEVEGFISEIQQVSLTDMTSEQLLSHSLAILEHIRTRSYVDFVKAARLGFYYSQRLQDLLQHKLGMSKEKAQEAYSQLNQGLDGSLVTDANIAIAQANSEDEALQIARTLVGHFNSGEMLEIRHMPLRDDAEALRAYVEGIRQTGTYEEQFERQKEARIKAQRHLISEAPDEDREELEAVIRSSQGYMALRETIKYTFAKEYLLLRDALEVMGERLGLESGDVYFLYPRELPALVSDPQSMLHLIRSRRRSYINRKQLDLPAVIRESDIDNLGLKLDGHQDFIEAKGKFLAGGKAVEGIVVNMNDFVSLDDARTLIDYYRGQGNEVILVATQINLSHDPLISQSSGLIIENAGIVAHGAQRARELGKGAIGGIKVEALKTGMKVLLDPTNRLVRKME